MRRFLFIAISVVVLFSAVGAVLFREGFIRFNYPSQKDFPVKGIDISHHQGPINWDEVKEENITFIFMKATEGVDFKDPRFQQNLKEASKRGYKVGAYHFYRLCRKGSEQAANYIANVPKGSITMPPVIDLEFGGNCLSDLPPGQVIGEIQDFIRILRAHYGTMPMIYSTNEFYKKYISDHFRDCPIWIRSIYSSPDLNDNREWTFWQYANRGRVKGIKGLVDLNVYKGSHEQFNRLLMSRGGADTLNTDQSVERFLAGANSELKNFNLHDRRRIFSGNLLRTADSLKIKAWEKVDLDGNGTTDIVACGLWGDAYNVIAVISRGDKYQTVFLNDGSEEHLILPQLQTGAGGNHLILHQVNQDEDDRQARPRIQRSDTVVFNYGNFIERKSAVKKYNIDKIRYRSGACFGTCPVYELELNMAGCLALYNAEAHTELQGKFSARLDTSICGEMRDLLNHLDFPKLKDRYAVAWTDDQTHELEIFYNGGKIKKISDYGGQGTRGLSTFYERMWDIARTSPWEKK